MPLLELIVTLIQLKLLPVEENVQGFEPWAEIRFKFGPGVQIIVQPAGRLFTVKAAPEEQTSVGPERVEEIEYFVFKHKTPLFIGSSQLLNRVSLVPPPVQDLSKRPYKPITGCSHLGVPPCNCPTILWMSLKSGDPEDPTWNVP